MTTMYTEVDTFWTPHTTAVLTALDFDSPTKVTRRLVGLHGVAQSGKDTIAGMLKGYGFQQVAFAQPILDYLVALDPIVSVSSTGSVYRFAEVLAQEGYEEAKKTPEFRRLMQVLGTEVGREKISKALGLPQSLWIEIARRSVATPGKYTISDVRFADEVDMVREEKGLLVKVKRPGYGPINDHVSDAGLPDHLFDLVIDNDGTLPDLQRKVADHFGAWF